MTKRHYHSEFEDTVIVKPKKFNKDDTRLYENDPGALTNFLTD